METAFRKTAKSLCFLHPHIPHAVAVMVMALAFHTKDPDGVGYTLNIFLFPKLSPLAGLAGFCTQPLSYPGCLLQEEEHHVSGGLDPVFSQKQRAKHGPSL